MTDKRPTNIIGLTLDEVDPDLFEEVRDNLESGSLSHAATYVTKAQRATILTNLIKAKISGICECGQSNCRTYNFDNPAKNRHDSNFTIRFHVRGELLMYVSADMDVIDVERLYDLDDDGEARTAHGLLPDDTGCSIDICFILPDEK